MLGSVGSGAEIVAGGSIHIYGALRGRAMAGVNGNSAARIYCQKIEAELLAIDGYYQTAEDIDASLRNRPGAGMARRRHHENYSAELIGKEARMAKVLGRDIRQRRRRKDDFHRSPRRGARANGRKGRGRRFRRRPAQSRSRYGRGAAGRVRPHQRGAGRRQALAGADPRQASGKSVAAAGVADPGQGCADRGGGRQHHRRPQNQVRLDSLRQPGRASSAARRSPCATPTRPSSSPIPRSPRCAIPIASSACSIRRP